MGAFLRTVLVLAGAAHGVLAAGFVLQAGWAVALWPWEDGRLSYLFVGSVLAAFAVGALWSGVTGRIGAAAGSLRGIAFIQLAGGAFLLSAGYPVHGALSLVTGAGAVVIWRLLCRYPAEGTVLPRGVRWSCRAFAGALALAGVALILRVETVFPWPLKPESSTLFGIAFLGLATIYADTAWRGEEGPGVIVMSGFLAYDLILLPAFLPLFATVAPERMPSLVVYVAVLVWSAAVAVVFLVSRSRAPRPPA